MDSDAINVGEDSNVNPIVAGNDYGSESDATIPPPNAHVEPSALQDDEEEIMVVSAKGPAFGSSTGRRQRRKSVASTASSAMTIPPCDHITGISSNAVKTEPNQPHVLQVDQESELEIVSQIGPRSHFGNPAFKETQYALAANQNSAFYRPQTPEPKLHHAVPQAHPKLEPVTAQQHVLPVQAAGLSDTGVTNLYKNEGQSSVKVESINQNLLAPTYASSHDNHATTIGGATADGLMAQNDPDAGEADANETSVEACQEFERLNALHGDASEEAETPPELNVKLHPHQKCALAWMAKREKKTNSSSNSGMDGECRGGLFCDDQGLGKTLSTIALMYKNPPNEDVPWKTLIVCPVSLVHQWKRELNTRVKRGEVKRIHVYHGSEKAKSVRQLCKFDVVITTYGTVAGEYPKILKDHPNYEFCVKEGLDKPTRNSGFLFKMTWNRVVLDEAHHVRNHSTDRFKGVFALKSKIRWALTGTPVQNTVNDLYALLLFIRFYITPTRKEWNSRWKSKLESYRPEVRTKFMKRFQAIIAVVMLRRTKKDKIKEKPILNLPDRITEVMEKELIYPEERKLYISVQNEAVLAFDKVLKTASIQESLSVIFVKFLRLRQACFHPYLIEYCSYLRKLDEHKKGNENVTDEEMQYAMAMEDTRRGISIRDLLHTELGNNRIQFRTKRVPVANSDDEDFLDDRPIDEIMQEANDTPHPGEVSLDELNDDDDFVQPRPKKRRRIVVEDDDEEDQEEVITSPVVNPKVEPKSIKSEDIQVIDLTIDGSDSENSTGSIGSPDPITIKVEPSNTTNLPGSAGVKFEASEEKALPQASSIEGIVDVKKEGNGSNKKRKIAPATREQLARKIKEAVMQPSTKMKMLIEKLQESKKKDPDTKSLVFSQWTSCLDIVQFHLENVGFKCCRLDGKMTMAERGKQIESFSKPRNNVFLISLKAGGEGLNLVMASQVFLVDAWWNPAVEEQAIDRVHRIGQTKDVHIFRFKMLGTFEETVYKIADKKREVIAGTMGRDGKQTIGRQKLTMAEIFQLFRSTAKNVLQTSANDAALAAAKNILGN